MTLQKKIEELAEAREKGTVEKWEAHCDQIYGGTKWVGGDFTLTEDADFCASAANEIIPIRTEFRGFVDWVKARERESNDWLNGSLNLAKTDFNQNKEFFENGVLTMCKMVLARLGVADE